MLTLVPFSPPMPLIEALAGHSQCYFYVEDSDADKWNEMVYYHKGMSRYVVNSVGVVIVFM